MKVKQMNNRIIMKKQKKLIKMKNIARVQLAKILK